jgi:hypothetical protein
MSVTRSVSDGDCGSLTHASGYDEDILNQRRHSFRTAVHFESLVKPVRITHGSFSRSVLIGTFDSLQPASNIPTNVAGTSRCFISLVGEH